MAAGEPFTREQSLRLERATLAASGQTGIRFVIVVAGLEGADIVEHTQRLLSRVAAPGDAAVLVAVAPQERLVRVATTPPARERISDQACALSTLSMTTSFGVGDLVGGMVNGLRMLSDAAGRLSMPGQPGPGSVAPDGPGSPIQR